MIESIQTFIEKHKPSGRGRYGRNLRGGAPGEEGIAGPVVKPKITRTVKDNTKINNLLDKYNCIYFVEDDIPYWAVMTNTIFAKI